MLVPYDCILQSSIPRIGYANVSVFGINGHCPVIIRSPKSFPRGSQQCKDAMTVPEGRGKGSYHQRHIHKWVLLSLPWFYVPGTTIHFTDSCQFLISSAFKFTALCTILPQCVQSCCTVYNLAALYTILLHWGLEGGGDGPWNLSCTLWAHVPT